MPGTMRRDLPWLVEMLNDTVWQYLFSQKVKHTPAM